MQIREYLKQPFDYFNDKKAKWLYIISAIVFALLFLIIFQPYGISEEMSNPVNSTLHKFLFFFSVAFSTFTALTLSQFVFRQLFNFQNVSNEKYILWLALEALFLLLINFGMSFIVPDLGNDFEQELNIWFQVKMYPKLLLILIFPFFGTVIYIAIKRLQTEVKELDQQLLTFKYKYDKTKQKDTVKLLDENNQLDIALSINEILYLESSNQYVVVNFIKNNTIKKHIVRNRLKHILSQADNLPIKQCHRSFAINLIHVKHLTRKNGKVFLVLNTSFDGIKIPVSNSFLEAIKKDFDN
ncbi:MAG: LytTR family DNA-binding domain-containing protein [Xanthomarina gelatinilytica]|uniref:LytTR family DNA-binding domain-containing protein n=1 Tax=Xanthomarina gelatinilytica TaxID=1137281 RepID=UPI003A861354